MVFMFASSRKLAAVLLVAAVALIGYPSTSQGADDVVLRIDFANGTKATIYPAEYLTSRTTTDGTRGTIDLDNGLYLTVITDINDPLILNKGDGEFHPFSTEQVVELLDDIEYTPMRLGVEVYVLPFPRSNLLVSSTSGRRVFLSPHVREISVETAAYIVAHEMGHVFQDRYLPADAHHRWSEYRELRDIEDEDTYHATAIHANRPAEILAEDFRVLYGGPLAYFDGRIENTDLPGPTMVPSLYAFFARLSLTDPTQPFIVSVTSVPNPFNPSTELQVRLSPEFLDTGDVLNIRIYDVRGALVRELYANHPNALEVRVQWDGRDQRGREVASSVYFGVVHAGEAKVARKLLMIK